jgi:hypothetical protein
LRVGPTKKELRELLKQEGITVFAIVKQFGVAKNTVLNRMKEWSLKSPKGFFSLGKKRGRPKGIPMSKEQKKLRSKKFAGEGNPFHGRKHTKATKKKMSDNHADITGDKNPFRRSLKDPKKREAHKQRCLDTWSKRDAEWRDKFGEKVSKGNAESGHTYHHKNHESGVCPCNKSPKGWVHFRSSWERRTVELLDDYPIVSQVEYESLTIPYTDKAARRRYARSDFLVEFTNGERLLIEVKPEALVELQRDKIAGHEEYCICEGLQYVVFMEPEIKSTKRARKLLRMAYDGKLYVEKIVGRRFASVAQYVKGVP